jgi:aminoglycoside 3-N-acetyltransferase
MTMTREAEAVAQVLDAGRVPKDGVLVMHSSFKGLSRAGFDAEAFIEALLARLPTGTLLMPAMTWRSVTPAQPHWDEIGTASHVGILTEIFRTRYAQARSIHPTHSVCGYGPATADLLAGHHLGDTPCAAASPWGRLADADAHILMLGVGFEHCTLLHHPEEVVAVDTYLRPAAEAVSYRCTNRNGNEFIVKMRHHLKLNRAFPQYDRRPLGRDHMATGTLPDTAWRLFRARDLMADAFANLRARADAHIAPQSRGDAS